MSGLEPSASRALQALAAARTPARGAAEHAWLHMQQRIVDGRPPLEIAPAVATHWWIAAALGLTAVAAAATLVLTWGARPLNDDRDSRPATAPYSTTAPEPVDQATPVPSPPSVSTGAMITPAPVAAEVPQASAPARPATSVRRAPPVPEAKTTSLAAEMRLLGQANAAMRAGDAGQALATLEEHRRTFAKGQLAPEREHQRAVALCELGRREAARKVVSAFARTYPKSPLLAKTEGVCRE